MKIVERSQKNFAAENGKLPVAGIDRLLTIAEAAAVLQVSRQSVRNWIQQGKIAAARVGREYRIRRSVLIEAYPIVESAFDR